MTPTEDFAVNALLGQLVSLHTLGMLVGRGILTVDDAEDVIDTCLLNLEETAAAVGPEFRPILDAARATLERTLHGMRDEG